MLRIYQFVSLFSFIFLINSGWARGILDDIFEFEFDGLCFPLEKFMFSIVFEWNLQLGFFMPCPISEKEKKNPKCRRIPFASCSQ